MKKGFTLLELIVVIVIIGILAAISLPSFQKIKEDAESKEAKILMRQIQDALKVYHMEHDWPSGCYFPGIIASSGSATKIVNDEADIISGTSNTDLMSKALKMTIPAKDKWVVAIINNGCVKVNKPNEGNDIFYLRIDDDGRDKTDPDKDGQPNGTGKYSSGSGYYSDCGSVSSACTGGCSGGSNCDGI